jgi:hypothetical protein
MDNQIKTSFIPRKTIDDVNTFQTGTVVKKQVGRTIFSIIATFIFIGMIAGGGLVYVWQIKIKKDIAGQIASMERARDSFDEKFIQEASRLDTRIEVAKGMLANHVGPSSVYGLFEEYTLQTVAFSQLGFKDNQDGTIGVTGSGEAARYESIVLQSDAFGKSGYLRNVIFTNLRPDAENKRVNFSFEATLDPKLILYRLSLDPNTENN